ncbi:MAG: SymE family type I addiction module toxin [Sulfuricellaceae bacterium]
MVLKLHFGHNEVKLRFFQGVSDDMEKANRRILKVVRSNPAKHLPHLSLKGRWLERAGFTVGMRVKVFVMNQCLIVLPSEPLEEKVRTSDLADFN